MQSIGVAIFTPWNNPWPGPSRSSTRQLWLVPLAELQANMIKMSCFRFQTLFHKSCICCLCWLKWVKFYTCFREGAALDEYKSYNAYYFTAKNSLHTSVATKLRRFLSKDPSLSSSSVHFQLPKNLRSFNDFRPKIAKIFWENLTIFWTKLSKKVEKYVLFLKLWTSIFPT